MAKKQYGVTRNNEHSCIFETIKQAQEYIEYQKKIDDVSFCEGWVTQPINAHYNIVELSAHQVRFW